MQHEGCISYYKERGRCRVKIERINENQIKCTLTSFDLSIRNLNLGELAYGNEKVRGLFRDMMQQAKREVGFEAEDTPVMIEAIPLSDESITLIISKVEEPEELDTRFARFSPAPDDIMPGFTPDSIPSSLLEEAGIQIQPGLEAGQGENDSRVRVYIFDTLDDVSQAAGTLGSSYTGESVLYKDPAGGKYYLMINGSKCDPTVFASTCNVLSEYGRLSLRNYSGQAFFDEHFEKIIGKNALSVMGRI